MVLGPLQDKSGEHACSNKHLPSLASQTLFPVFVGVAGSAAGKKGLVSLGHIPLQRGMQ